MADPLETRETARADDQSAGIVAGLVGGLLEIDETGQGVTAREIVDALNDTDNSDRFPAMREAVTEAATNKAGKLDARRLGYTLRRYRGRIAKGFKIEGVKGHQSILRWTAQGVRGGDGGDGYTPFMRDETEENPLNTAMAYGNGPVGSPPSPPLPPTEPLPADPPLTRRCRHCGGTMERLPETPSARRKRASVTRVTMPPPRSATRGDRA